MSESPMNPGDAHNRRLLDHVRPAGWTNPVPEGRYQLVVIGAGAGGLVTAVGAAGLGAKVALVERALLGGDCLNTGCVPSKALIASARRAAQVRAAQDFGVMGAGGAHVDFPRVMGRMRALRADIGAHDAAARMRDLGVDVFLGEGRFVGADCVAVGDTRLHFKDAVVATGARPFVPPIPGLAEAQPWTPHSVFEQTVLPARLAVLGAGPVGCELAQCFARFGAQVHLFELASQVLPREDADAAQVVADALQADGVVLHLGAPVTSVDVKGRGRTVHAGAAAVPVDALLVALGRRPNAQGLGLEQAGVEFDERTGVVVDDHLRSSNPHVWAVGDVALDRHFTHAADQSARTVIQNALFPTKARFSKVVLPAATYTDPEVGRVGLSVAQAQAQGVAVDTYQFPFSRLDRAILDGQTAGFARVLTVQGGDRILGATIVGAHAGELVASLCLAMSNGLGLAAFAQTVHAYPTRAEVLKRLGDAYNRSRLTPTAAKALDFWMRFTQ